MDLRTARRVSPAIAAGVAIATVATGTGLLIAARSRLPEPVAVHWGPGGTADGFQSLTGVVGTTAAFVLALTLLLVGITIPTRQPAVASVASGTSVFMGALMYGGVLAQQGITDPATAPMPNAAMAIGVAAGVAVGVGHALLVRTKPGVAPYPRPSAPDGAVRAHVPGSARVAWSGRMRHSSGAAILMSAVVALLLGFAVWMWQIDGSWWLMLLTALLVAATFVPMQMSTVVVDATGVVVRVFGRTLRRVELSQIKGAQVVEVRLLGQYGGYGIRAGFDGSQGFITASGEALRLARFDAADLVLTVDGADQAAAVVNTLIDRQADTER